MAELRGAQPPASSNVYTVLALIALLILIAGIVIVIMKAQEITGQSNPWHLVPTETALAWTKMLV